MILYVIVSVLGVLAGTDGQFTVTIVSYPAGTPVSGSTNTFDYPILSSVTLTCMVDPSPPVGAAYQWTTGGCFNNDRHDTPTCFPTGQTTQNVTGNNLLAEDAGTITCTVNIDGVDYTSGPFVLRVSGIAMTRAFDIRTDLVSSNQITDYSFVTQPFILDPFNVILRCASGLGPSGSDSITQLGGWYFNGAQVYIGTDCYMFYGWGPTLEVRGANPRNYPSVMNLYLCGTFTTTEEGIYSCIMMNSSMMNQTMRVGVYFSGRTAPMINPPSSSTVSVVVDSRLTLSCTSQGSPPDTFTWRKDSGPIVQSTSITTVTHTNTSAVFRANYSINSVTTSDSGTYTCTVTNPIGSDSETITVNVVDPVVTIISTPAGTPVSGSTNTFDYPILSSVTLTCMVTPSDGSTPPVTNYQWNTGGCFTNNAHSTPTCFPAGQTTQNVTGNNLLAEDAGTITCTVTIGSINFTSGALKLRISGIAIFRPFMFIADNQIIDYSFVTQPFTLNQNDNVTIFRCATGLGPSGSDSSTDLGGWYFNGAQIPVGTNCGGPVFEVQATNNAVFPGGINLLLCGPFTTTEEGVYSCIMMNSSMMEQTMRVGVYFSGRTAPMIDPPSSSTVTVVVGSPLTLSCTSQGSPPDTFTWRKDSGPIVQFTSITTVTHNNTSAVFRADYSINNVTTSDFGTYTCTVSNPIGSDSETITVVTPFTISLPDLIQGAKVGSYQEIQCMVSIDSELDFGSILISWMGPGGDTITSDSRVTINPTTSSGNTYTSRIQFTYLMEGDEGTYMCNVMSSTGASGSESVEVDTLTIPLPSVSVTTPSLQRVCQSLTLECSVAVVRGITSRVDIIWSRDGTVMSMTNGTVMSTANDTSLTKTDSSVVYTDSYTIPQLCLCTSDQYQCEVVINTSPPVMATGNVTLDVMVTASSTSTSDEDSGGVAAALGALLAILLIGLVISLTVNILLYIQRKKARLEQVDLKQKDPRSPTFAKLTELEDSKVPAYDVIDTDSGKKDVKMTSNPAYDTTDSVISDDEEPAYM